MNELLYRDLQESTKWTLGHLGQSLDGRIATQQGSSEFINGPENIDHLHRLRALADCVVIGAGTLVADDPQLTVRRCAGRNPLRVILDTKGGLRADYQVFQDGRAQTLVFSAQKAQRFLGKAEVVCLESPASDTLDLDKVIRNLEARGLRKIFIEGGGLTVSRFLEEGLLSRLQITIAPLILGSGISGITLPPISDLSEALRPDCTIYPMGRDVLFDCVVHQDRRITKKAPGMLASKTTRP